MPRFGLNGATTGPADLLTDVRAAREAGYQALEIRDTKLQAYLDGGGTLYALRQQIADAGLEVASLNALEKSTLAAGAAREAVLRRCRILCEWAAALDCPYVVAVPSPRADAPDPDQIEALTVDALRALAQVAERYGVRVGFEFLGFADCSVNTLAAARRIVDAVAHPAVGLVLDAFHFYVGGSTWEMLEGLSADRLYVVHLDDAEPGPRQALTDAHRLLPGDGVIPLRELVRRLEALGYRGVYSVELFRPEYYRWDPVELARAARAKMEALFGD
ncbi:MAG: sugar phosphate isomerase/epimerase family protein [Armatimonadota bacterium]|nr:sugar phosphate isomerase/epimerase family protein [Armatimonadota bacterium]MDR7402328.1 sugar phosphate isomerase/epimerase family protein [Armatimonadota bacterium]MDR7404365.1 sugar phosphate isomerase/epimerase family protein [Armatimonadota bacterium]MDR7472652.1 sugar phosphate isomerase/epimerase family protein [Armatimonadota bacterium]MDR7507764.1 sugar phosphate isomerase/epimerase family protein [Armatimonadota bacterium]